MESHHTPPPGNCEDIDEDTGTIATLAGRYYDCTFCKRGFTNAQALGGHMNIHRRDRARGRNMLPSPACPVTNYRGSIRGVRPLFPLISDPPMERGGIGEEAVNRERMHELRRYGKELGLGFKVLQEEGGAGGGGDGKSGGGMGGIDLNLGL